MLLGAFDYHRPASIDESDRWRNTATTVALSRAGTA